MTYLNSQPRPDTDDTPTSQPLQRRVRRLRRIRRFDLALSAPRPSWY